MAKDLNKVIKIDGAPGLTLEGKKGATGKNGGMLFYTDCPKINYAFSIFDMWSNDSVSSGPIFIDKRNFCNFAVPSARDYIVTHVQNMVYVYIVNSVLDKNSIINRDLTTYVNKGVISAEYAKKILNYYSDGAHNINDCCLVTEINSLVFRTNISNSLFDIEIYCENSTNAVGGESGYVGYTGIIMDNLVMETESTNTSVAFLNIIPGDINISSFNKIRIEAEFYTDNVSAEMCSIYPSLWSNPGNDNLLNMNYPSGYLENYDYKITYDSENLENFTVILKDFNESIGTGKKIPLQLFEDYTVCIYAYIPDDSDNSIISKYFIAELNGNDLIAS